MSRKDYRNIAGAINNALKDCKAEIRSDSEAIDLIISNLCIRLLKDNARFNPVRFEEACYDGLCQ